MSLVPGSLTNGEWVEATSLARTIEQEMIADELIDLDEEVEEATLNRRETFVAISRAIVKHLTSNLSITIDAGALRDSGETGGRVPAAKKTFTVVAGKVEIGAGALRAAADGEVRVPLAGRTLTGKAS